MKKFLNVFLATITAFVLITTTSIAKADASHTGTLTKILKIHNSNSLYPSYEGYFTVSGNTIYWGISAGYCAGIGENPSATDFALLSEAKVNGSSVTIYYQAPYGTKCYTGFSVQ